MSDDWTWPGAAVAIVAILAICYSCVMSEFYSTQVKKTEAEARTTEAELAKLKLQYKVTN